MQINRALKYTNAHPRDTGTFVPYLIDFVKLLHPAELHSSTGDILNSYLQYINVRGVKMNLQSQAQVGFRRAFKKLAIRNKIKECTNPRGYYIQVPRISRSIIDEKCKELLAEHTQVFDKLFVNKKIGYGMFAKCDISIKYNLIEYKGQWITSSENKNQIVKSIMQRTEYLQSSWLIL